MKLNQRIHSGAVAAAVALACGSGIVSNVGDAAGFVTVGSTTTVSRQYVSLAAATHTIPITATVTLGVSYSSGDRIRLDVTNASFATSGLSAPTSSNTCNVDQLTYDGTVANFRVQSANAASGSICRFPLAVRTSTIAGNVTLGFSSFIAGTTEALETRVTSTTHITRVDQFSAAVTKVLAGVVDVEKDRYHFTADDNTSGSLLNGFESQLHIRVSDSRGAASSGRAAAISSVTVNVVGDFSWLDDDGLGTCSAADLTGNAGIASLGLAGLGAAVSQASASFGCAANGNGTISYVIGNADDGLSLTSGTLTLAFGKGVSNTAAPATSSLGIIEKRIPAPSSYTASVDFTYFNPDTGAGTNAATAPYVATGTSAGAFTLNGSSINVPFMPYGSGITRVLYLTNRSAQAGAVSLSLIADGTSAACTGTATTTAKQNGVTLLSTLLDDTVTACYGATFAGKVAVTVTSNTPSASTEVFSGYNRSGDIVTVVNSSNGK